MDTTRHDSSKFTLLERPEWYSRFRDKYVRTSSCWEWIAAKKKTGYGQFQLDGKTVSAHRLIWILYFGPIPDGMHVLHYCDNPSCVRPRHLYLGTHRQNMNDKKIRKRVSGTRNPNAKLTDPDIEEIFRLAQRGLSQRAIGASFGVTHHAIWRVLNNKYTA